ncbi:transposase, partial [Staphylococcus aureus]|nr:transposase [Staphylococcus aureus]
MIKHERTNVYDFNFHLVWVTKYRKPVFTTEEKATA